MTDTIAVKVDPDVAEYYRSASDMDHRKVEFLLNSFLSDMMTLAQKRQEAEAARGPCRETDLERRRTELIANLGLQDVPESGKTLSELMDEISHNAQQRGLTWEILQSILNE